MRPKIERAELDGSSESRLEIVTTNVNCPVGLTVGVYLRNRFNKKLTSLSLNFLMISSFGTFIFLSLYFVLFCVQIMRATSCSGLTQSSTLWSVPT